MQLRPVEILTSFDPPTFMRSFLKRRIPVVVRGFARDWPAFARWNYEYFKSLAGDVVVPLYDDSKVMANTKVNAPAVEMKMGDYLDLIASEPTSLRIFLFNIFKRVPSLMDDIRIPGVPGILRSYPTIFFGGKNARVFPHFDIDMSHVFHVHFNGRKKALLFSQENNALLYKLPFSVYNLEDIDLDQPDFKRFPALKHASGYEALMEHGDLLFMPSGCWHYMHYLDDGFSVSLRAIDRSPFTIAHGLWNLAVIRNIDNIGRNWRGQQWLDYKDRKAISTADRALGRILKSHAIQQEADNKLQSRN